MGSEISSERPAESSEANVLETPTAVATAASDSLPTIVSFGEDETEQVQSAVTNEQTVTTEQTVTQVPREVEPPVANPVEEVQSSTGTGGYPPNPPARRRRHTVAIHEVPGQLAAGEPRQLRRPRTWFAGEQSLSGGTADFQDDDELHRPWVVNMSAEPDPDFSQEGPLSLKTRVEYSAMPKNAMQAIFGLVTVEASAEGIQSGVQAERQPMDLVCVLDVSGSMGSRNKIDDLKAAVRFIISESLPSDRLSLVTFQSSAARELRLRRMDREGQDEATVATLRMTAGGGTRIAHGLDLGLQVLEQRRQRNKVCAILLLTDGQDSSCKGHLPQLLQRASKVGCGIYPFGFGADHDSVLLRELSERAKTPFTYVEDTSGVKEAFAGVVGGLSSIVAQRVHVTLTCRARLKDVNTAFEVQRPNDKTAVVVIPDIFAEERRDILVELEVPADDVANETVLLEVFAQYVAVRDTAEVRVQTPVVTMSVQRIEEPQPEQEPDEEVFQQRQRWEVSLIMEEASRRSDQGQFEEAREMLVDKRKTLSEAKATPMTQALQVELEDAESRMRNFGTWTIGSHEVRDASFMHQMQRTTNTLATPSFRGESGKAKSSKSLYVTNMQSERIRRSTISGLDFGSTESRFAGAMAAIGQRRTAQPPAPNAPPPPPNAPPPAPHSSAAASSSQ